MDNFFGFGGNQNNSQGNAVVGDTKIVDDPKVENAPVEKTEDFEYSKKTDDSFDVGSDEDLKSVLEPAVEEKPETIKSEIETETIVDEEEKEEIKPVTTSSPAPTVEMSGALSDLKAQLEKKRDDLEDSINELKKQIDDIAKTMDGLNEIASKEKEIRDQAKILLSA